MTGATLRWSLGSVLSTTRSPRENRKLPLASCKLPLAAGPAGFASEMLCGGAVIAFTAYLYLLAHAAPALATSYAFVNPVIALFLGVVGVGEVVTGAEWISCGVILLGVVLIYRGKRG